MKKIFLVLVIIAVACIFIAHKNSNPKGILSDLIRKGIPATAGDLSYRIYLFGVFPVGKAVLKQAKIEEYDGQKVYHLAAAAQTSKVFSWLFSGSAVLDSYVDMKEFDPLLFKQKILISGKPEVTQDVIYDQNNHMTIINGVKRQIFPNTQDPLSTVFNIRRMDLDKTKEFEMSISTKHRNYILRSSVSRQSLSIDNKPYNIIFTKANIKRRGKSPYHQSNITMTLLKAKENIPILIKVFSGGFFLIARLTNIAR